MSHLDELDEFEAELELQLKREYTAVFGLFVFIDELLKFIQFGWSHIPKRDSKHVLSDPLHARIFDGD